MRKYLILFIFIICLLLLSSIRSFAVDDYSVEDYYPGRGQVLEKIRQLQAWERISPKTWTLELAQELNALRKYDILGSRDWLPFHFDACAMPLLDWLEYDDEVKQSWTAEACDHCDQVSTDLSYVVELSERRK